jgi:hypothetical protein
MSAAVVDRDDAVILREPVGDARVPAAGARPQVRQQDQRNTALRAELSVGERAAAAAIVRLCAPRSSAPLLATCRSPEVSPRSMKPSMLNHESTQILCQEGIPRNTGSCGSGAASGPSRTSGERIMAAARELLAQHGVSVVTIAADRR